MLWRHDREVSPMRVTECAQRAVHHARGEAGRLGHDRVGTEHLLLALLRDQGCLAAATLGERGVEAESVRRRVEETAGPGPLEAGPGEPLPPDRGPPPWEPPAGASLRRVVPLASEHPLPSGDLLVLLSLEIWSDWFDLRYAIAYATPEPEGNLPRPSVLGPCEVSDRAGTEYVNWVSSIPAFGMVRIRHHTFVPAPPPGTEVLELRFGPPSAVVPGEAPPLVVSTVVL
jgi:hypothetical protein